MDGVGDTLEATHKVTSHYEFIIDEGEVSFLEGTCLFVPDIKFRMLVPQDHFIDPQILENEEGSLIVTWYKSLLKISYQEYITIKYDHNTHPPMLHSYKSIHSTVDSLSITEGFTS